ncbi:DUF6286 domain-containing protein [Nocardia sp. CDC159]|uniref:DUF6286 domain-containing protein n=1 Tax=Nocardia pulmonis TaxID=2951408 RepID=A0A9X2IYF5_9NOCA|nr:MULTISPECIES: DUF6286 domain-containing protein [Nocardia]MCM6776348.1 DUF6286 domain-containing protein [Nocardia pulmonis]MCM6788772.1 DUF6286 domain-containing protein [Nocardia sp. CDC159]
MRRSPRRVAPAVLVALIGLACCAVVVLSLLQRLTGAGEFVSYDGVANRLHEITWADSRGLAAGLIAGVAGVALLALALLPGRSILVPLVADDEIAAGVGRRGLDAALRAAAQSVEGVRSARVRLRRKRVRITAKASHAHPPELPDAVRAAVDERIGSIGPCASSRLATLVHGFAAESATDRNRPARLNRVTLGVLGALLLIGGGYALAAHYGRLGWVDADGPLLSLGTPPVWGLWTIVVFAIVMGLACIRWLSLQGNRLPAASRWRARPTGEDTITLDSATAARPVVADIETYAGVRTASAWLLGPGIAPELHLMVTTTPDADVLALRRRILTHALPRLRQALEVEAVPVTMELHLAGEPDR